MQSNDAGSYDRRNAYSDHHGHAEQGKACCGQTQATVGARPGWSGVRAVRSGAIVLVDDSIASEWGPRIVLFLEAVAKAVKTLEASTR